MSVANYTPRLGLISPVDSDTFAAADYAATFGKLDAQPGIKIVSSYTALTTYSAGFTTPTNHHGEVALDTSTGAEWWWNCPSGAGSWKRLNSLGVLKSQTQASDISSTATTGNGALVLDTGSLTFAGGRAIEISCYMSCDSDNTNNNGLVVMNVLDGSTVIRSAVFRAGPQYGGTVGTDQYVNIFIANPAINSSHDIQLRVRAAAGQYSNGAGGTATSRNAVLTVKEV